jgi:hypothetical protein
MLKRRERPAIIPTIPRGLRYNNDNEIGATIDKNVTSFFTTSTGLPASKTHEKGPIFVLINTSRSSTIASHRTAIDNAKYSKRISFESLKKLTIKKKTRTAGNIATLSLMLLFISADKTMETPVATIKRNTGRRVDNVTLELRPLANTARKLTTANINSGISNPSVNVIAKLKI